MDHTLIVAGIVVEGDQLNPFDVKVPVQSDQISHNQHVPVVLQSILDVSTITGPNLVHLLADENTIDSVKQLQTPIPTSNVITISKGNILSNLVTLAKISTQRYQSDFPVIMFPAAYHVATEEKSNFLESLSDMILGLTTDHYDFAVLTSRLRRVYSDAWYFKKTREISISDMKSATAFEAEPIPRTGEVEFDTSGITLMSTGIFTFRPQLILEYVKEKDPNWYQKVQEIEWGKQEAIQFLYSSPTTTSLPELFQNLRSCVCEGDFDWYPLRSMEDVSLIPNMS